MASNLTIIGSSKGKSSEEFPQLRAHYRDQISEDFSGAGEIREEFSATEPLFDYLDSCPLGTIREESEGSAFSAEDDVVYVVVGRQCEERISLDALIWTLDNVIVHPSSMVFLVHVFPETKFIPSPLGNLPVSQVNQEQKELYMAQQRGKRRDYLQKFLNVFSTSQVKVDTILIESEVEATAILDLIPILNIRKLVLGATKSTVRRLKSKKGHGVAEQVVQNAPEFCEVKIICEGKDMSELIVDQSSSSPSSFSQGTDRTTPKYDIEDQQTVANSVPVGCGCFKI